MRRLAIFSFSFAAAAAGYVWLLSPAVGLALSAVCVIGFLVCLRFSSDALHRVRIAALGAALGLLWSWGYERLQIAPLRELCGEDRAVTAQVCDSAVDTDYGCRVTVRVGRGRMMLYLDCKAGELSLGDTVSVTAEIVDVSRGSGDRNNLYYQSQDISLLGFQRGKVEITKAQKLPDSLLPARLAILTREKIGEIFPEDVAGFAKALLTGDRSGLSYAVRNELSITGISHVIAVSGMHVSLIVGVVMFLCRRRRKLAAVISIAVMFFFAAMLGFTPSVTRAAIMNTVLLMAPIFMRENDAPTSLSLALLVILLSNPWAIANVSLQLSFLAVTGIFVLSPHVYQSIIRPADQLLREKHPLLFRGYRSLAVIVAASFGATLTTAPLVAVYFGLVSLISPLTNLLAMPVLSLTFTVSFLATVLGFLWTLPAQILGWLLAWPIRYVLWLSGLLAKIPYGAIYTCSAYTVVWLIGAYGMLAVYAASQKRCRLRFLLPALALTLAGAMICAAVPKADMTLKAFDVGQGQCILLQNGKQTVLVDCGGDEGEYDGEDTARELLSRGIFRVDALILTHYDADHIGGAAQFLERVGVDRLVLPDLPEESALMTELLRSAEEKQIETDYITEKTVYSFGSGSLTLFPPPDRDADNASLSALMSDGEYDILITGDLDSDGEAALLAQYDLPDLEVLVAGHHGSKYSTSARLLRQTTPELVLICVGENSYGHPTQEVLNRIAAIGAAVLRTDESGDITITR